MSLQSAIVVKNDRKVKDIATTFSSDAELLSLKLVIKTNTRKFTLNARKWQNLMYQVTINLGSRGENQMRILIIH